MNIKNKSELLNQIKINCTALICPMCGSKQWTIEDKIFELREFNQGNLVLGGPNASIVPLIVLTCSKCGNTQFLNAIKYNAIEESSINKSETNNPNSNGTK